MAADAKHEDKILEGDAHEVLSSWIACKEAIPKHWKGDVETIKPMSHDDLQIFGVEGCHRLVSRARKASKRLTSLSNTLRQLASLIQVESEAAQENYEVVSNMCNLIILPNELLARIFHFIVNGDSSLENSIRSKAAITLSHVSRYFRDTALSCASLWSNISGRADLDLLCLSRSKDAPLDVAFAIDFTVGADVDPPEYELFFGQSVPNILPHSKHWRSLDIQFVSKDRGDQILDGNPQLLRAFREADVRKLESLCLRNINYHTEPNFYGYHEFHQWITPNLRHLTSVHFFPFTLPGLTNLTSLDITFFPGEISLVDVHKNLSRMEVIESFALKLEMGPIRDTSQKHSFAKLELSRVRNVRVEMESQRLGSIEKLKPFFSSLSFPKARDLHVKLLGYISKEMETPVSLYMEVGCVLQHSMQYPRVERFRLEAIDINIGPTETAYRFKARQGYFAFSIPLSLLPSLKHFTLRSNNYYLADVRDVSKTPKGKSLHAPALETITVQIALFAIAPTASLVEDILTNQKERCEWGKFRELVVIDDSQANGENGGKAMRVHTGDSALEWCKRRNIIGKVQFPAQLSGDIIVLIKCA
ncbi:hypothetical protein SCHPADRAFT_936460 [Schizopora paradoxa]|uniref:Uncharacterized protein n=1 Tax=Schizopora paradoxa TaxID=27342 RepID=A0A0H2S2D8_9AGAM|nr:hypothetical protein SCHPADRAFT_936460 [Schizopora paradoxa]